MNWTWKVFKQWQMQRNETTNDDSTLCPLNLLECPKVCEINCWLSQFGVETRLGWKCLPCINAV